MATSSSSGDIYIKILADLDDVRRQMGALSSESKRASADIKGAWDGLTGSFAEIGLAINGVRESLNLALAPIRAVVGTASEFESLRTRLVGLYGSVEAGSRAFERFNTVASQTPFSLKQVVEAGAQLKAFGADAEGLILDIANLAAFMGTDIVEAANTFGRAFAGGAGAADILRERGVLNLVKSFKGIEDLSKTTLPEFRDALISTIQDPAANIAGSSDRLSKTFTGAVSNMQDSLDRFSAAVGEEFLPALTDAAKSLEGVIAGLTANLEKLKTALKDVLIVLGVLGLGLAVVFAGPIIAAIGVGIGTLSAAFFAATGTVQALFVAVGAVAGALPILRNVMALFGDDAETATSQVEGLFTVLRAGADSSESSYKKIQGAAFSMLDGVKETAQLTKNELEAAAILEEAAAKRSYDTQRAFLQKRLADLRAEGDTKAVEAAKTQVQLEDLERQHAKELLDIATRARQDAIAADNALAEQRLARQEFLLGLERQQREDFLAEDLGLARDRAQAITSAESESVEARLAALDRLAEAHFDNAEALKAIDEAARQIRKQGADRDEAEQRARAERAVGLYQQVGQAIGVAMGNALTGGTDALRNGLKAILQIALDALRVKLFIAKGWMTAEGIFNFTSLLKNIPLFAALEGMFAFAKTAVTAFDTGGLINKPTLALMGERRVELVAPKEDFLTVADRLLNLGRAEGGAGSQKMLAGVMDRLDTVDRTLQRLLPQVGREAGLAAAGAIRGRF